MCTKNVLPQVLGKGNLHAKKAVTQCDCELTTAGLRVNEVAHDQQVQVSRYVTDELGFLNSYDTWHGRLKGFMYF